MFKRLDGNKLATIGGFLTSIGVASVIDWETFDIHKVSHWFKFVFIIVPAIGGWMSTLNKPKV